MKIKINDCLVEVQNGATYSDAAATLGLEKGALAVGDVYEVGDIEGRDELRQACEMGKNA